MVHQWQLGPNIAGKSLFLASKGAKRRASKGSSIAMFDYQRVSLDHFGPFHFHVTYIYIYIYILPDGHDMRDFYVQIILVSTRSQFAKTHGRFMRQGPLSTSRTLYGDM